MDLIALIENPESSVPIKQPNRCTGCGTELRDEGTRLYCPNPACSKLIHHRIEKWINTLDIQDFGTLLIKRLFDVQRIRSVSDLYTLTVEELAAFERMGQRSAEKVYRALHTKRESRSFTRSTVPVLSHPPRRSSPPHRAESM